jgi:hypothetical protein
MAEHPDARGVDYWAALSPGVFKVANSAENLEATRALAHLPADLPRPVAERVFKLFTVMDGWNNWFVAATLPDELIETYLGIVGDPKRVWSESLWARLVVEAHARGGTPALRETGKLCSLIARCPHIPSVRKQVPNFRASRPLLVAATLVACTFEIDVDSHKWSTSGVPYLAVTSEGEEEHSDGVVIRNGQAVPATYECSYVVSLRPLLPTAALDTLALRADPSMEEELARDPRWNDKARKNLEEIRSEIGPDVDKARKKKKSVENATNKKKAR